MKAFFADIRETGLIADRGAKAWGSTLELPAPAEQTRLDDLRTQIEAAQKELKQKAERLFERRWQWEDAMLAAYKSGDLSWRYQRPLTALMAGLAGYVVLALANSGHRPIDRESTDHESL